MSFGRRMVLFFVLIALLPTVALIGILLFISNDSRRGKADAHLAASLQTGLALYARHSAAAEADAKRLAKDPELARAMNSGDTAQLQAFVQKAAAEPGIERVEVTEPSGNPVAAAGPTDAIAFAEVGLTRGGQPAGNLRVSTIRAGPYVSDVQDLTKQNLVLTQGGVAIASTVPPPAKQLDVGETADLTAGGHDYRGHLAALNSGEQEDLLVLGPRREGSVLGISGAATAILVWFLAVAVVLAWVLARALTRLHDRVAAEALTDPLTGLWNRRWMGETLEREVARAVRFGHEASMIILDVDDFKMINDRHGHLQGDVVLERVADRVREVTRSIDVAARYGGDELALVLVETGREGARLVAERLQQRTRAMKIPMREGAEAWMHVTLSLGVATIPDSAEDLESLVDAADHALLRAKGAGKDQIRVAPTRRAAAS